MITCKVTSNPILDQKADCYAFTIEEGFAAAQFSKLFEELTKKYLPDLLMIMKQRKFTGKLMDTLVLPMNIKDKIVYCIFVGVGKHDAETRIENYRRAIGHTLKQVMACRGESVALHLMSARLFGVKPQYLAKQVTIALNMAAYHFNDYITTKKSKGSEVYEVTLCVDAKHKKEITQGIKEGECIADAVNKARHWVDLPPSILTPPHLADKAKEIAKRHELGIKVFAEKQINKMGMGGLSAVSRGSDLDCYLVILEYRAKKKNAPTVVFVGKGITFDSGGLSIKPSVHMETMKEDMSGAAAVIATMGALAQLKPDINVIGITPLSENLPSDKATKPGDIACFYNGKTAEIKNTDAEGRLVLADALSYAVKHCNPDAIIDVATLTGACAYALGPFHTGLMGNNEDLIDAIYEASEISGELVWRLPMGDDYKQAIKSEVADMSNIGSPKIMAGAITAAHFLQNFVDDVPWAHLDIAGTAFNVPNIPYYRPGATGVGVRLLVELAMNW